MKTEQRACTVQGCVCLYAKPKKSVISISDELEKMIKERDDLKKEVGWLSINLDFWRKETNYWKGKRYSPENTVRLETGS